MEYLIAFPSYYKAAYAQEILGKNRISSTIKKTPTNLLKSCGYSVAVTTGDINSVTNALSNKGIASLGVFHI